MLVMKEGRIIESGEVQFVFDHTTEPYISCKEIAMQALKTACTFYGGDWAGTLEVDLDFDV